MSLGKMLKRPGGIPWFIVPIPDMDSSSGFGFAQGVSEIAGGLVILDTLPKEVSDSKQLNYSMTQIPGGHSEIARFGSIGARKVSFSIEIANFNDELGVSETLAQFEVFRRPTFQNNPVARPFKFFSEKFTKGTSSSRALFKPFHSNPSALYWHGASSVVPLLYRVVKCDFTNSYLNPMGRPQKSTISFELVEDTSSAMSAADAAMSYALGLYAIAKKAKKAFGKSKSKGHPFRQTDKGLF